MKVGVCCEFPGEFSSGDFLRRSAQAAERVGFSSYWFGDHVLLFGSYESKYPYGDVSSWGKDEPPIPDPRSPFVDPVMGMCWVAAATSTIEVGTSILILPQRNPVVLAKEIACLDEMSRGRVTLGVGVGWCKDEAEAIGVDWAARGRLTDEYIDVMKTLWTTDAAEFDGPTISFSDAYRNAKNRKTMCIVRRAVKWVYYPSKTIASGMLTAFLGQYGMVGEFFFYPVDDYFLGHFVHIRNQIVYT